MGKSNYKKKKKIKTEKLKVYVSIKLKSFFKKNNKLMLNIFGSI